MSQYLTVSDQIICPHKGKLEIDVTINEPLKCNGQSILLADHFKSCKILCPFVESPCVSVEVFSASSSLIVGEKTAVLDDDIIMTNNGLCSKSVASSGSRVIFKPACPLNNVPRTGAKLISSNSCPSVSRMGKSKDMANSYPPIAIVYINGIHTALEDAKETMDSIQKNLLARLPPDFYEMISFQLCHNRSMLEPYYCSEEFYKMGEKTAGLDGPDSRLCGWLCNTSRFTRNLNGFVGDALEFREQNQSFWKWLNNSVRESGNFPKAKYPSANFYLFILRLLDYYEKQKYATDFQEYEKVILDQLMVDKNYIYGFIYHVLISKERRRVFVIAHSQGNLFVQNELLVQPSVAKNIEAVYSLGSPIIYDGTFEKIRYFTHPDDIVVRFRKHETTEALYGRKINYFNDGIKGRLEFVSAESDSRSGVEAHSVDTTYLTDRFFCPKNHTITSVYDILASDVCSYISLRQTER